MLKQLIVQWLCVVLLSAVNWIYAQPGTHLFDTWIKGPLLSDSLTSVLSFEDCFQLLMSNHPIVRQNQLLPDQAKAEIRMIRGLFDPVFQSDHRGKEYNNKTYYLYNNTVLKIPTWYSFEFKTGIERNTGDLIAAENATPAVGLAYAGATVNLSRIIFDERRAVLKQAQLLPQLQNAEQIKLMNKIVFELAKAYWNWYFQYRQLQLLEKSVALAEFRLGAVIEGIKVGDRAQIDSIEAGLEVQKRTVTLLEGRNQYIESVFELSNFLWDSAGRPLEIMPTVRPVLSDNFIIELTDSSTLIQLLDLTNRLHPELIKAQVKLEQLKIDRRLRQIELLPELELGYFPLQRFEIENMNGWLPRQNYKFGAGFYFPLFLRKARGKLELAKIKVTQQELEITQLQRELINNVRTAFAQLQLSRQELAQQTLAVNLAVQMQQAEQTNFENGESSLFLVNTRERVMIEEQIKLEKANSKVAKATAELYWSAGQLTNNP